MHIPEIVVTNKSSLTIDTFREMDYLAVEKYDYPVELMMEHAGTHLARLAVSLFPEANNLLIGVGTGNNGGGGLVAARRLAGWGRQVFLHLPDSRLKPLPARQLKRALAAGAEIKTTKTPDLFLDAYLGFSQRLPLSAEMEAAVNDANLLICRKISLDLPTGFDKTTGNTLFKPDAILTLAAMKSELFGPARDTDIYLADIGLPAYIYHRFGIGQPAKFQESGIVKIMTE